MSRRTILVAGLVALQALALMVVLGITYIASQDVLLRYAEGLAARIARDATAYTEDFLDPANDAALLSRRLIRAGAVDPADRDALARYLFELIRERPEFAGAYLGFGNGDFVYASRDGSEAAGDNGAEFRLKTVATEPRREVRLAWYTPQFRRVSGRFEPGDDYDPRTRPWYRGALAEDGMVWTDPYIFFTSGKPGITAAVPVPDPLSGAPTGVIGVDIGIEALSGFLETLEISPRGSAAILAQSGDIVAHSDEGLVAVTEPDGSVRFARLEEGEDPILTRAAGGLDGRLQDLFPGEIRLARFEAGGETWLTAVQRLRLERTPWTVVTYLPESDILAPLWEVRRTALLVALAALVATACIGLVFARTLMRPR